MKVGVLGLQGAFIEHINKLNELHVDNMIVNKIDDFDMIDSLIIPGGESTVMLKLLKENNLLERLLLFIHQERKIVMGICAGIIILASQEVKKH